MTTNTRFTVSIPEELRACMGVRLAMIRAGTGKRLSLKGLVEELLRAWLAMPFEANPDAIQQAAEEYTKREK